MSDERFSECPCCGAEKYGLLQDKIHLDWARECLSCGFAIELMPRSSSRNGRSSASVENDDDYEAMGAGLRMAGGLEDLFVDFATQ